MMIGDNEEGVPYASSFAILFSTSGERPLDEVGVLS